MLLAKVTETSEFQFAGMPAGWLRLLGLMLLIALAYLIVWLYQREARAGAALALRMAMAGLRIAAMLLLALIWLEPVIATYRVRETSAHVAVLMDASASMGVVDVETPDAAPPDGLIAGPTGPGGLIAGPTGQSAPGGATRIERVAGMLQERDWDWLRRLAAKNELGLYTFGERVTRLPLPWTPAGRESGPLARNGMDARAPPPVAGGTPALPAATEERTDLGLALMNVLEELGDGPIAGVVVITDGGFNAGMSVDEAVAYVRRHHQKIPVHAVGVGSPTEPPNVRVESLSAPATVPKGDPLELRVEVSGAGVPPSPLRLELSARRMGGPAGSSEETVVASRELTVGGESAPLEARFKVQADAAGEFLYRARLAALPGEAVTLDNTRAATVVVLDERLRVLVVAGRPSYDYRYVTRLLERDRTIDVSCWLQNADERAVRDGDVVITSLPRKPEELFEYDAILLLDPDPRELDSGWAITLKRFVDEFGGGLLLQAGPHYTMRLVRDPRLDELTTILPVVFDQDADVRLSEQGTYRTQALAMQTPEEALTHPLTGLHPERETCRAIWAALPGVWWHLPVLREKPLATVLLRQASGGRAARLQGAGEVLLAVQPVGAGRTALLAFDSTWRWRSTAEPYFNRFWVQFVRYLAQTRRQGLSKRGTIVLDGDAYNVGDFARIEVRVLDERYLPLARPQLEAVLEPADGPPRTLALEAVPGREGWFAGRVLLDAPGPAVIRVPLPERAADFSPRAAPHRSELRKHLYVSRPDLELRALRRRDETLIKLCEQTGGRYVTLSGAGALPDWIPNATWRTSTREPDRPLWDNGWTMGLLATLLCVEWLMRRRHHLL